MITLLDNSISVLMCTYHKDNINHFHEAINSLKIQSKYIDELVIIKNGNLLPQHNSIIEEAKKHINIKIRALKKNVGLAKALNKGLEDVSCKWVARFDSDDICCKNRFKDIKNKINLYGENFDVFGGLCEEFDKKIGDLKIIRKVPLDQNNIKNRLIISNPLNHVTVVFKKELYNKISKDNKDFYPLIDGFEDYALWVKLLYNNIRFKNFYVIYVFVRVGNNMYGRRGGLKYIINELRFRKFLSNYLNTSQIFISNLISLFRISIFLLPPFLKKYFYLLKRKLI